MCVCHTQQHTLNFVVRGARHLSPPRTIMRKYSDLGHQPRFRGAVSVELVSAPNAAISIPLQSTATSALANT